MINEYMNNSGLDASTAIYEALNYEDNILNLEHSTEKVVVNTVEDELRCYIRNFKLTRKVGYIVQHCTATQPHATVTSILNYWKNVNKWKNVGYHILLTPSGFVVLSNLNNVTNGALGYNSNGIHISYIGGIDANGKPKDTRTDVQKRLMQIATEELVRKIKNVKVIGHNEVAKKACPSYKVSVEYLLLWTGL